MTFLKKLGQILLEVVGVATGVGPIIAPFLGSAKAGQVVSTGINDLSSIASVIVQIETAFAAVPGSTGAQKLQASIPLIANIIKTSEIVAGKKIGNDALFTQAVTEYAQATVDLLNAISPDSAQKA